MTPCDHAACAVLGSRCSQPNLDNKYFTCFSMFQAPGHRNMPENTKHRRVGKFKPSSVLPRLTKAPESSTTVNWKATQPHESVYTTNQLFLTVSSLL